MNTQRTNREWIDAFTYGDSDAIRDLYDILYRHVYHFVRDTSYVDSFDLSAYAEDVTQDAIIAIDRSLSNYKERSRFTSWACAIARNKAMDGLRRKQLPSRAPSLSLDAIFSGGNAEWILKNTSFDDSLDELDERALLVEIDFIIRNHLSDKQRYILFEWLDGATDRQIASDLNIPVNNVYQVRFDIKAKIIDLIGRQ